MSAPTTNPNLASIPQHIAIIMDGNGRWAKGKGLERVRGHERGAEAVRACIQGCLELGVRYLTLYAFSTENWKRPKSEVTALMSLLERFVQKETSELLRQGVKLETIGELERLPASTRDALTKAIQTTAANRELTLILALSYSSRVEIVEAAKRLAQSVKAGELDVEEITPELFSSFLYTAPYPDPDLVIRTSGEMRLSNFLLWQASYSELYVTKTLWPDFRKEDLLEAVKDFSGRNRRFGGVG